MTLEDLRYDDAGTYWCGIERSGTDMGFKFAVIIDPGMYYPALIWALVPPKRFQDCSSVFSMDGAESLNMPENTHVCLFV